MKKTGQQWEVNSAEDTLTSLQRQQVVVQGSMIPEPETYTLLLAGLGLIGVMSRRSKTVGKKIEHQILKYSLSECTS